MNPTFLTAVKDLLALLAAVSRVAMFCARVFLAGRGPDRKLLVLVHVLSGQLTTKSSRGVIRKRLHHSF